ncbi:MAG: hypothetical protein ACRDFB_10020, partial [Rhabdochlamydiaceae bacterium]
MVVGVERLFALSVGRLCGARRNEDGAVPVERWDAKSVTGKNNLCVGCGECCKKTVQTPKHEGWGFCSTGLYPAELHDMN